MDWSPFLSGLLEDGRLEVPSMERLGSDDLAALGPALAPYEAVMRGNAPDGAPPWDEQAGAWAAAMFYRACQFAVHRDLDERAIRHQLSADGPRPTPSAHYSVDLCFRYLPQLLRFARSAAEADPLVEQLATWARQWPLSSVGAERIDAASLRIDGLLDSPVLLQIYVDRIVLAGDHARLSPPAVHEALNKAVGAHPQLASAAVAAARAAGRDEPPQADEGNEPPILNETNGTL